jgi:hypothetical protein
MKKLIFLLLILIPVACCGQGEWNTRQDFDAGIQIVGGVTVSNVYISAGDTIVTIAGKDFILSDIRLKLDIADTTAMLANYLRSVDIAGKLDISDTVSMLLPYALLSEVILPADTAAMLIPYINRSDTAAMLTNYALISHTIHNNGLRVGDSTLGSYNRFWDSIVLTPTDTAMYSFGHRVALGLSVPRGSGGVSNFLNLTDTPNNFTDDGYKDVKVNLDEDALMFLDEPVYNVLAFGADPTGVADATSAIQAACDAAYNATNGKVYGPSGDYLISSAITIRSDADFTGATFNITGTTDTAVIFYDVGPQIIKGKQVIFPRVVQGTAPVGGAWTGTSVGVAIINSYNNTFYAPYIEDFVKGLLITSEGSNGAAHNIISFGDIIRCKIGLALSPGSSSGYTNSNKIIGGRITEYPGYEDISGHHGVVLDSNDATVVDNNLLTTIAMDGDSWENQVVCYGIWNTFQDFRLEPTDEVTYPARVFYGYDLSTNTYAFENLWIGGYKSDEILFTRSSSATDFAIMGASTNHIKGNPPLVIQPHVSIDDPAIYIMRSDYDGPADPDSTEIEYGIRMSYRAIEGKQNSQTNPQWGIVGYTGEHEWGPGSTVYDTKLYRSTTKTLRVDSNLIVDGTLSANKMSSTGAITGATESTEHVAASVALTYDSCLNIIHVNADADAIQFNLPAAVPKLSTMLYDDAGGVITAHPNGTDVIKLNGTALAAGNTIDSPGNSGDFIVLYCITAGEWVTLGQSGTWVDGGP